MMFLYELILGLYGWFVGIGLYLGLRAFHVSCSFEFFGEENLKKSNNHIFVSWHKNNIPFFVTFVRFKGFVWMTHGATYMRPVHILLKLYRAEKLIMGSSGHGGREAADELVAFLKKGYSTQFTPDGPSGPAEKAHKGVLHIAAQSQVPIIPVMIKCEHRLKLNFTWDQKRIPLPFSKIKIFFGPELRIQTVDDEALSKLEKYLSAEPSELKVGSDSLSL